MSKEIKDWLRERLSKIEIYKASDKIGVVKQENRLFVYYRRDQSGSRLKKLHFDIQLEGEEAAYINSIEREEEYRGRGFGRDLYRIIEDFCRERKIKRIQLTSSGTSSLGESRMKYWESCGFSRLDESNQMVKNLI